MADNYISALTNKNKNRMNIGEKAPEVLGINEKVTMFASDLIMGRLTGAVCPLAAKLPPR